jgi:hypothetical protein
LATKARIDPQSGQSGASWRPMRPDLSVIRPLLVTLMQASYSNL